MTFLLLQPLTEALLSEVVKLDQKCFGGLWSLDGYRRELASPNSELIVLQRGEGGDGKAEEPEKVALTNNIPSSTNNQQRTTNNFPSPLTPHPSPLIGIGCYWAILEEAHITILGIAPECQRQGLGQALFYVLLHSAQQRGLERATLEVRISNQSALSLYQKFGFQTAGQRKRYYQDTGEDALVLWRGGLQSPEFPALLQTWWQEICDRLHRSNWQLSKDWAQTVVKEPGLTR